MMSRFDAKTVETTRQADRPSLGKSIVPFCRVWCQEIELAAPLIERRVWSAAEYPVQRQWPVMTGKRNAVTYRDQV